MRQIVIVGGPADGDEADIDALAFNVERMVFEYVELSAGLVEHRWELDSDGKLHYKGFRTADEVAKGIGI